MKNLIAVYLILFFGWCQLLKAQDADLMIVVASGTGNDVPSAKKDAYRTAVEQAVGKIIVDAETLVENDAVIQDQVLFYSSAYVESSEVLGDPVALPGGLVRVRIKALVRRKKLEDKLRVSTGSSATVEGESLFTELVSRQDQWQKATAVIRSVFEDFPLKVMTIRVLENERGRPALELDQKTGEVIVSVCISVDLAHYNKAVREIREKIGPMALKITKTMPQKRDDHPDVFGLSCLFWGAPDIHPKSNRRYLFLCGDIKNRQGVFMEFDLNHYAEIQRCFALSVDDWEDKTHSARTLVAEVRLCDLHGLVIRSGRIIVNASDDFRECHAFALGNHEEPGIMIAPFPVIDSYDSGLSSYDNDRYVNLRIPAVPWGGRPPENGYLLKDGRLFVKVSLGVLQPEELRRAARVESHLEL